MKREDFNALAYVLVLAATLLGLVVGLYVMVT
jgi:hypothetical protein